MSIDGYVEDQTGGVGALYADLATLKDTEPLREDIESTGAVVMGRKAFAMASDPDFWCGGRLKGKGSVLIAAAAARSVSAIR